MARATLAAIASALLLFACGCSKRRPAPKAPVMVKPGTTENGIASWYGHPYHGRRAANGEVYDMESMVAAHRTLPFGANVRVTNLANGKKVDVRIIDRGPFVDGRIIDLSRAAARQIDMIGPGTVKVRLLVLGYGPPVLSAAGFAVQVGSFVDKQRAEDLANDLKRRYAPVDIVRYEGLATLWRVLVGSKPTQREAEALASELRKDWPDAFVVRRDDLAPSARSSR